MAWKISVYVDVRFPGITLKVSALGSTGILSARSGGYLPLSSVPAVSVGSLALSALSAVSA